MKEYDATETAYKNGYKKGVEDILAEIEEKSSMWGGERHINLKRFDELKKKYTDGGDK